MMCKLQGKDLLLTNVVQLVSLCYISCTHISCSPIMLHFLILYCFSNRLVLLVCFNSMQSGVPIHYLVIPVHRAMFPFTICDSKIIWSGYLQGDHPVFWCKRSVYGSCLLTHLRLNILHSIYFLCICDLICQLFWKEEWKIYFCLA